MPLAPGHRFGPYEILAPLGAGGMGEVYRARDTRLGREVAIKVLPQTVGADPQRLARFEREAQLLFEGETISDVLAAVLRAPTGFERLPAATPPAVRRILERCLERDPKLRLRDIGEARIALDPAHVSASAETASSAVAPSSAPRPTARAIWIGGILLGLAAAAGAGMMLSRALTRPPEARLRKFQLSIPDLLTEIGKAPTLSPDGRRLFYLTPEGLWVRELDQIEPRLVVKGAGVEYALWSPDGREIAYLAERQLWRIPSAGGEAVLIAPATFNHGTTTPGGTWLGDGRIAFAPAATGSGLLQVPSRGGDFTLLMDRDGATETDFHKPSVLPDGKTILFVVDHKGVGPDTIGAFVDGSRKVVLSLQAERLDSPVYSPTGHVVYQRNTGNPGIWAAPFSSSELRTTGEPFLIVPHGIWPSVSADGTLLATETTASDVQHLAWVDRRGEVVRIGDAPLRPYPGGPRISPDGRRIAYFARAEDGHNDLFVHDLIRNVVTRVTSTPRSEMGPVWSPSGDRIFFQADDQGPTTTMLMSVAADGSGSEETHGEGAQAAISADGRTIYFARLNEGRGWDLYSAPIPPGGSALSLGTQVTPLLEAPASQQYPAPSPDGRLLAYAANDGGSLNVYLTRLPAGEGHWQVSSEGGSRPRWSPKGDRLYYLSEGDLFEVEVRSQPSVEIGTPRRVVAGKALELRSDRFYDLAPDGQRFLFIQGTPRDRSHPGTITVIENWFEEFRGR